MDDSSFVIRVPRNWVRIAATIAVTALVVAPLTAVAAGSFTDVPESNAFEADIEWLAEAGVTRGCNPPENTEFCPEDSVTRAQMSAFMHRFAQFLGAENGTPALAEHAATADRATTAGAADSAESASHAETADHSDNADSATNATSAGHADTAGDADTLDGYHAEQLMLGETPPSGTTIRGTYSAGGTAVQANSLAHADISFGFTLEGAPTPHFIRSGQSDPACPGSHDVPEADPGHLCIYEYVPLNVGAGDVNGPTGDGSVYPFGARLWVRATAGTNAGDDFFSMGTWAVTVGS